MRFSGWVRGFRLCEAICVRVGGGRGAHILWRVSELRFLSPFHQNATSEFRHGATFGYSCARENKVATGALSSAYIASPACCVGFSALLRQTTAGVGCNSVLGAETRLRCVLGGLWGLRAASSARKHSAVSRLVVVHIRALTGDASALAAERRVGQSGWPLAFT